MDNYLDKNMVIYDFQAFFQKYGGVSRCFAEAIKEIREENLADIKIGAIGSYNYYINAQHIVPALPDWTRNYNFLKKGIPYANRKLMKYLVKKYPEAVFHATYYDPYLIDLKPSKLVCTIHDMIFEKFPYFFNNVEQDIANKKRYIYESNLIFAASQKTKDDIMFYYPDIPSNKIQVTYWATNIADINLPEGNLFDCNYFLYIGTRNAYKNFETVLKSINKIKAIFKDQNLKLICIGGGRFTHYELDLIRKYELLDLIEQKTLSDEELALYYKNAKAFVFPSTYEGFGIPILEAYACGCPVILSNSSCFPEIAGDAALYFDASDYSELAQIMIDVYTNEGLRNDIINKGKMRLENYSWKKTANEMINCYSRLF